MIHVEKIRASASKTQQALGIREEVFVKEQNVPKEEEYDTYEEHSHHFLAYSEGKACGTSRWRLTEKGVKLERFAVLATHRRQHIGAALLTNMLSDIDTILASTKKFIYLHAQVQVVGFYEKFGFQKVGEPFEECHIWHYKMIKV